MPDFRFYHPIEIRYSDLDPQAHVNNAKYLTYMEQARLAYIQHLGLWEGASFLDIGIILAEIRIAFHASIQFGQRVRAGVRVSKLGNKSINMDYRLEQAGSSQRMATGSSVLVAYDYRTGQSIPIPAHWRAAIAEFEQLEDLSANSQ
jgi:acyl-CoA thioester hydrolase